ncbi:esterase-like activity of phytase family protein [Sphingomonas alba]|uniref:Esterase-like activity of phytase family protein n=1 Tax=Sphingomonas alba TaxID=2908208 RepID=A0ABT0RLX9_9SPHN|nr:esterase-like activity of phytase family protein [Sphingomonas alba]MCL6683628.1 esterase-like activity of phytase family protein [Sphingomonas alba]
MPNRSDGPRRSAAAHFTPIQLDPAGFAPLRLAGAWQVEVTDPRFGGLSALAIDRDKLMAVTDSGSVIWLPRPGTLGEAEIRDLPAGPGTSSFKSNRDSEAVARDPKGRGWWVAFERWNQLWLYDEGFRRPIDKLDFGVDRWPDNRGIEGLDSDKDGLILFPELGGEWLEVRNGQTARHPLGYSSGYVSDALKLPDGRLLVVTRAVSATGLEKGLAEAVRAQNGGLELRKVASLPLAPTANVEGITAEPRPGGGTRLWLVTDNDFRPRAPTLLVALDLP